MNVITKRNKRQKSKKKTTEIKEKDIKTSYKNVFVSGFVCESSVNRELRKRTPPDGSVLYLRLNTSGRKRIKRNMENLFAFFIDLNSGPQQDEAKLSRRQ